MCPQAQLIRERKSHEELRRALMTEKEEMKTRVCFAHKTRNDLYRPYSCTVLA